MKDNLEKSLDSFLKKTYTKKVTTNGEEVCDIQTGECHVISGKDGIVERINKKFITEDGRQLLED